MSLIFIVEDNENLREAVVSFLRIEDYQVQEFGELKNVYDALVEKSPDLLILDAMLPDGDGFFLAKRIREKYSTPIIFVTARNSESNRITGFELGCDDYVVKPFSPRELVLRVKALLKRANSKDNGSHEDEIWQNGEDILKINRGKHTIFCNSLDIDLTATEWKILDYLISSFGNVISRNQLLTNCLDYNYEMSERTIITHIRNLRGKMGKTLWVETVRGFGYRFTGKKI